jgi:hypothetical protein
MARDKKFDSLEEAERCAKEVRCLWLLGHDASFRECSRVLRQLGGVREIRLGWQTWMALPRELGDLRELRSLTVLNTPVQSFPDFLAACPKLTELVLRGTDIETIPASIREFRGLRRLDASNNPLRQISSELGSLPELRELLLTEARLRSLPDSLRALPRLQRLMLTGNRFSTSEAQRIRGWFRRGVVSVFGSDEWDGLTRALQRTADKLRVLR